MHFESSPTSITSNSFVSLLDADTFFTEQYGFTSWPVDKTKKEQLLITASARINEETFVTKSNVPLRKLQFPITGHVDRFGIPTPDDQVPTTIKEATFIQAYFYLREGLFTDDELHDLSQVSSMSESVSGVSRSYTMKSVKFDVLAPRAKKLLQLDVGIGYANPNGSNGTSGLLRL